MSRLSTTPWTHNEKQEFVAWHERVLIDRGYPPAIVDELRNSRIKWLASVPARGDARGDEPPARTTNQIPYQQITEG